MTVLVPTSEVSEKHIEVDGKTVEYFEVGQGEKTLVFLSDDTPAKLPTLEAFAASGYRVLAPRSTPADARLLAGFVVGTSGGAVRLVAESGGGASACWLAVLHPELVSALALGSPTAFAADANQGLVERLHDIHAPTLVVWGTEDTVVPPEQSAVYETNIRGSRRMYIYRATHDLSASALRKFVDLVTDFNEVGPHNFVVNVPRDAIRAAERQEDG
jgi:pimeloyl-ACP methyl ester carboxylesterase